MVEHHVARGDLILDDFWGPLEVFLVPGLGGRVRPKPKRCAPRPADIFAATAKCSACGDMEPAEMFDDRDEPCRGAMIGDGDDD